MTKPKGKRIGEHDADEYMTASACMRALRELGTTSTPAQICEVIRGIGYGAWRILDEKPGLFGDYHSVDAWRHMRALRNGEDPDVDIFDVIKDSRGTVTVDAVKTWNMNRAEGRRATVKVRIHRGNRVWTSELGGARAERAGFVLVYERVSGQRAGDLEVLGLRTSGRDEGAAQSYPITDEGGDGPES